MCRFLIRKADRTVLTASAAVSAVALALAVSPAAAQPAFYQVSENEIAGQPGTIIRQGAHAVPAGRCFGLPGSLPIDRA